MRQMTNSIHNPLLYKGYRIISRYEPEQARELLDKIQAGKGGFSEVLRDNKNSFIAIIRFREDDLVVKVPRSRNRRIYERLLTLFRNGEAFRRYDSMLKLIQLGLNGAKPVLAAEKRRLGMVTHNVFVYEYIDGVIPGRGHEKLLFDELLKLHSMGYTRRDSKPGNFLISDGKVHFIDFRLTKPILLKNLRICMELNSFFRAMPSARQHFEGSDEMGICFRVAGVLESISDRMNNYRKAISSRLKGNTQ